MKNLNNLAITRDQEKYSAENKRNIFNRAPYNGRNHIFKLYQSEEIWCNRYIVHNTITFQSEYVWTFKSCLHAMFLLCKAKQQVFLPMASSTD